MRPKGCSDLPPDLLREIARRLHVAADFVRFHAICKPWRDAPDQLSRTQLLPWLLAPTERSSPLKLRCVFYMSSHRVLPTAYPRRRNRVCSAEGATIWYLTVEELRPTLHDPITGAVTHLPCFPDSYLNYHWEEDPCGIVYGDGAVFLYLYRIRLSHFITGGTVRFRAAVLRPGKTYWMLLDMHFGITSRQGEFCAAYHGGRILLTTESSNCRVFNLQGGGDVFVARSLTPGENGSFWEGHSFFLESHGEMLWVSVQVRQDRTFLLLVHALEEMPSGFWKQMRWVRKEGRCLANRVFFLGSPNSFSVDASLLGGHGGSAYFVCNDSNLEQSGVFRYNFVDGKTEFIETLPAEWNNEKCTWLVPKPTVTSIQEIIGKKLEAQIMKKQQQMTAPITSQIKALPH